MKSASQRLKKVIEMRGKQMGINGEKDQRLFYNKVIKKLENDAMKLLRQEG